MLNLTTSTLGEMLFIVPQMMREETGWLDAVKLSGCGEVTLSACSEVILL
jgi:hypothetical protein